MYSLAELMNGSCWIARPCCIQNNLFSIWRYFCRILIDLQNSFQINVIWQQFTAQLKDVTDSFVVLMRSSVLQCTMLFAQFHTALNDEVLLFTELSPNYTCCVTSRHVTTRYLAHAFWYRKKSYVLCRACCTRDRSVTTSATNAIRNLVCLQCV